MSTLRLWRSSTNTLSSDPADLGKWIGPLQAGKNVGAGTFFTTLYGRIVVMEDQERPIVEISMNHMPSNFVVPCKDMPGFMEIQVAIQVMHIYNGLRTQIPRFLRDGMHQDSLWQVVRSEHDLHKRLFLPSVPGEDDRLVAWSQKRIRRVLKVVAIPPNLAAFLIFEWMPTQLMRHLRVRPSKPPPALPNADLDGVEMGIYSADTSGKSVRLYKENAARHVIRQLLGVLWFMRSRDVVHRDVKPCNILLRSAPRPDDTYEVSVPRDVRMGDCSWEETQEDDVGNSIGFIWQYSPLIESPPAQLREQPHGPSVDDDENDDIAVFDSLADDGVPRAFEKYVDGVWASVLNKPLPELPEPVGVAAPSPLVETLLANNNCPEMVLSDLNVARYLPKDDYRLYDADGTRVFTPPECFDPMKKETNQGICGEKREVWAVGCTLLCMLRGRPPYYKGTSTQVLFDILGKPVRIPPMPFTEDAGVDLFGSSVEETAQAAISLSASCVDFLRGLLNKDSEKRFSYEDALFHPWLAAV